jgi:hypothetical protein
MARTTEGRPRAPWWFVFLVLGLALASPAAAEAAFPGANGRIALTVQRWRPPPPDPPPPPDQFHPGIPPEPEPVSARIVSVSPRGQGRRVLYSAPADRLPFYGGPITRPAFSPNGKLIAFDERGRLAIMRDDGTGLRMLPALSESDHEPAWSPTGGSPSPGCARQPRSSRASTATRCSQFAPTAPGCARSRTTRRTGPPGRSRGVSPS